MSNPRITYTPHPEITSERELGALAKIYSRAIRRYEEMQKGAPESAPDDARRSNGCAANTDCTR